MIYLDNCATTFPKPKEVYKRLALAPRLFPGNPGRAGYDLSLESAGMIFRTRQKLADMFGASVQNVAFCYNCTMAINLALKGFLKENDHVLISDMEHNAVWRPVEKLRRENKIKYDIFQTHPYHPTLTIESIKKSIRPNTKLLICAHASNVTGWVLPIRKIGEICKENGIVFVLDAAQSAGILPVDMQKDSVSALCLACHKGLYAPMGVGAIICDKDIPESLIEGGTGSLSLSPFQPTEMPERLEAGTPNVPGIAGLEKGLDFVASFKENEILTSEKEKIKQFYHAFKDESKVRFYSDYDALEEFSPVISFNLKGKTSEQTAALLAKNSIFVRGGFHCAALAHRKLHTENCGTVRISPSVFTTEEEINHTICTIKKLL